MGIGVERDTTPVSETTAAPTKLACMRGRTPARREERAAWLEGAAANSAWPVRVPVRERLLSGVLQQTLEAQACALAEEERTSLGRAL